MGIYKKNINNYDDFMNMLFPNQSGGAFDNTVTPGSRRRRRNGRRDPPWLHVGGYGLLFICVMYSLIYGNNPEQARRVINNAHPYGPNAPGPYSQNSAPGPGNFNPKKPRGGRKRTKKNRKSKNRRQKKRRKSIRRRRR